MTAIKFRNVLVLNGIMLMSLVFSEGLPLYEDIEADFMEQGRELMAFKKVSTAGISQVIGDWSWPSKVVVGAEEYRIVHDAKQGSFRGYSNSSDENPVVAGDIMRLANGKIARECAFGEKAATSMPLCDFARLVDVRVLDVNSNALYVTHGEWRRNKRDCLVYKNLLMRISGVTNKFDFAISLMNAGLPESERLSALPPRP